MGASVARSSVSRLCFLGGGAAFAIWAAFAAAQTRPRVPHPPPPRRVAPRGAPETVRRLLVAPVINTSFLIPAGAKDHEVRAGIPFSPLDVHVWAVTPHMHLLGRSMTVTASRPGGGETCLAFLHFTLDAENLSGASEEREATDLSTFEAFWKRGYHSMVPTL